MPDAYVIVPPEPSAVPEAIVKDTVLYVTPVTICVVL